MWDDIIGEPEGLQSLDFTWECSQFCFKVILHTFTHRVITPKVEQKQSRAKQWWGKCAYARMRDKGWWGEEEWYKFIFVWTTFLKLTD